MLKRVTAASARRKVTVAVLKDSLDRHFQIQMAASVSSFRTLIRTLAAKVSPAQLEQARYLVITPHQRSSSRHVT